MSFRLVSMGTHQVGGVNKRGRKRKKTMAQRRRTAVIATLKNKDFNEKTSLITRPCFHLSESLCHVRIPCLISAFVGDSARNQYFVLLITQYAMFFFFSFFSFLLHSVVVIPFNLI